MSISPYNNLTVIDLSNVQQPYVNSTTELGYFRGGSLGTIPNGLWYSLPASLNTNNGIASVATNGGLILNSGTYKINLSLFPTATQDGSSNISFNFGTTYLSNIATTNIVNAFGGPRPTGMFTYDPVNNPYIPGIISWVADGYNSANSTNSNFVKDISTNELSYNYFNAGYPNGGTLYSGNCTTEMSFIIDSSATIFFNVSTNSSTGVTIGNCSFTLELISTSSFNTTLNAWNFLRIGRLPTTTKRWTSVSSSSTGQYLAAVDGGSGFIYTSTNFGINWNQGIGPTAQNWTGIASSGDGQYYVAVSATSVWRSVNYGVNWSLPTTPPTLNNNWTGVASSQNGSQFVIASSTRGIWKSTDYGNSWLVTDASSAITWSSIASSSDGIRLAACADVGGIWVSINYGGTWTKSNSNIPSTTFDNTRYSQIVSSSNGEKLAAAIFEARFLIRSTNYGTTWTASAPPVNQYKIHVASSSDGNILAYVGYTGGVSYSINQGTTWTDITNFRPTPEAFGSVALSSDGKRLIFGSRWITSPTRADGVYIGVFS